MNSPDERIDYDAPQDDGWRADESAYTQHECARVAALVTRLGNCPERAADVERGLCEIAGINEFGLTGH